MEKTIFEQMGGTYEMRGDYRLPCLALPAEETPVGIWGRRHLRYIRQYRKALYTALLVHSYITSKLFYISGYDMGTKHIFMF